LLVNSININKSITNRKVLIAPLDWGLGHATRCIPIINELQAQGFEVLIAAENAAATLLKEEFSTVKILSLTGYHIDYAKNKKLFFAKMFMQLPKILRAIENEKKWLEKIIEEHKIDIVISDNRFGVHSKKAHCIFITHQLHIKTGNSFTEKIAQQINYKYINRFNECWVIDEAGENNLAAELSHPQKMPAIPVKYIGILSRFKKEIVQKNIDVVVLLSGPEPQRSIFEKIILSQIKVLALRIVLIRGLPATKEKLVVENVTCYNHLPADNLNKLLLESKIVIARSGYTTVMDIATLQLPAIFIPTPGQTEQGYLASYLAEKKYCIAATQSDFDVKKELARMESTNLLPYQSYTENLLRDAIAALC
jgi:uncharacterized protein (TIGR00661 family)